MRPGIGIIAASVIALSVYACEPCAGTIACHGAPEVSYSGQVIEHQTGAAVAGTRLVFVRQKGIRLFSDTLRVTATGDGFFDLRSLAYDDGQVTGDLTVIPPSPRPAYTIPGFVMATSRTRGDGGVLGRLVVDPYLLIVGNLRERNTEAPIVGAKVTMRRTSGAQMTPDTVVFTTDDAGSFALLPTVPAFGVVHAEFEIDAPGYPRKYLVPEHMQVAYLDGQYRFVFLHAGRTMAYNGLALRRGSWEPAAGTIVEFRRTGGIPVHPDTFALTVNSAGAFPLRTEPLADGEVVFDVFLRPPAPSPTEVVHDVRVKSHDGDSLRFAGRFGFGAEAYLRARVVNRATGLPADSGLMTAVRRVAGLSILTPLARDSGLRETKTAGILSYEGAVADSGNVTFDIEVRVPKPAAFEYFRGITIRARYDSLANDVGTLRIGVWIPATAQIVDDATGSPIANALVEFRRTGGVDVSPPTFATQSQSEGLVRLQPIPKEPGEAVGDLFVSAGAAYRDTTFRSVRLRTTQDDTLRSIGVFRIKRVP